jgi:hypothetical protein
MARVRVSWRRMWEYVSALIASRRPLPRALRKPFTFQERIFIVKPEGPFRTWPLFLPRLREGDG